MAEQSDGLPNVRDLLATGVAGDPGPLARQLGEGPGFSLAWDGQPAAAAMARFRVRADTGWRRPAGGTRGEAVRAATLVDPSTGLTVEVTYTRHAGPPRGVGAISWRGWITNGGERPVARLQRLAMLDVALGLDGAGDPTVRTMRGGLTHNYYPPEAFAVAERTFLDTHGAGLELDSGGTGFSTDRDAPYLVVADGTGQGGCFAALGWSALWRLRVSRQGPVLHSEGTVDGLDLTLAPGERIPLPEVLLGFYAGNLDDGANALRRVLRRDFVPLLDGAPPVPPVSYDHWFEFRLSFDEQTLRPQVEACAALGVEHFVVDAGWFGGSETSYVHGCGNWGREATHRFPSGLRAFADYVRAQGMQLGLWIDPELVHPESDLAQAQPGWLLRAPGSREGAAVLDLTRPEARRWIGDTIDGLVERYGIGWLRWDVNMRPAPNWQANDPPGRAGWHQLQHVAGVHEALDGVLARHPGLLLEGCCGGGRRMDLGLLRRSHTFWCSDHTEHAHIVRAHQSGGNRLLPAGCFNTNVCYGAPDPASPDGYPAAWWLSHCGGPLGLGTDFRTWTPAQIAAGRRYVEAFKRWRHLLAGDFYPLCPPPRSLAAWDGWQFDDPERGEGLVFAFRNDSPEAEARLRLGGTLPEPHGQFGGLVAGDEQSGPPTWSPRTNEALVRLERHGAAAWWYRRGRSAQSGRQQAVGSRQ